MNDLIVCVNDFSRVWFVFEQANLTKVNLKKLLKIFRFYITGLFKAFKKITLRFRKSTAGAQNSTADEVERIVKSLR